MAAGDDSALATIYDQYAGLVHGIALRIVGGDAPDICQDVFVTLWNQPERWDPDRGTLRTYLAMVARRRSIDRLRSAGRREANERRVHDSASAAVPNVEEAALAATAAERLREVVRTLPEPQRRAIELAYYEGLTFRQVAAATGASEGTAKSRIRLGLRRLADDLRSAGLVTST
jgi:RNA polymerase sigma-70 factor (ECF subfamily)